MPWVSFTLGPPGGGGPPGLRDRLLARMAFLKPRTGLPEGVSRPRPPTEIDPDQAPRGLGVVQGPLGPRIGEIESLWEEGDRRHTPKPLFGLPFLPWDHGALGRPRGPVRALLVPIRQGSARIGRPPIGREGGREGAAGSGDPAPAWYPFECAPSRHDGLGRGTLSPSGPTYDPTRTHVGPAASAGRASRPLRRGDLCGLKVAGYSRVHLASGRFGYAGRPQPCSANSASSSAWTSRPVPL